MSKLEFINKEIETEKRKIKINTSLVSHFDKDDDVANEVLSNNIKKANDRLKMLEQIKNVLEAWEVVKPNIQEETQLCESLLGKYYRNTLVIKRRVYDSYENKTKYDTLLKALEVEDDVH